jgi:hypothetical protein
MFRGTQIQQRTIVRTPTPGDNIARWLLLYCGCQGLEVGNSWTQVPALCVHWSLSESKRLGVIHR